MPILQPTPENLQRAAQLLRDGELVALPTETVYGLGANALDTGAVQKIFSLKERPSYNPLIIHVLDEQHARELVTVWPQRAQLLAEAFWPGALTLVLPKRDIVPELVTAGLPNVALRAPSHPVARQLLKIAQLPLAAPSANKFTQTSPTRAQHVQQSLGDELFVLDGGACDLGIESTVLDLSGEVPILLRPGSVSRAQIETVLRENIDIEYSNDDSETPRRAPGQMRKHYAPRAKLLIYRSISERHILVQNSVAHDFMIGIIAIDDELEMQRIVRLPNNALQYASQFYNALHELDAQGCDVILVEALPQNSEWDGVRDRLGRAASTEQNPERE